MTKKTEDLFSRSKIHMLNEMSVFGIMGHTIDIMQNAILNCKMAAYSPDVIIGIPNNACGFYEFNRAYEMIELGRIITKDTLKEDILEIIP